MSVQKALAQRDLAAQSEQEGETAVARKPNPYLIDDENPEWTAEDFKRARPASEVLPPELYAKLVARQPDQRGPQKAPTKVPVTLRLDRDVVEAFKADGAGWQTRINTALKKAISRKRRPSKAA
jgi:uncharacterized protein (DUF4415 family)